MKQLELPNSTEWKSEKSTHSGYTTESLPKELLSYLDDCDSVEVNTDTAKLPLVVLVHSGTGFRKKVPVIAAGRPAKLYVIWGIAGQYIVDILKNVLVAAPLWRLQNVYEAHELCIAILDGGRLAHARTDQESTKERLRRHVT